MGKFGDNKMFTIVISLIWGFGLALLFRKVCVNNQCVVVKVPPEFYQQDDIIQDSKSSKCYKLHKYLVQCVY